MPADRWATGLRGNQKAVVATVYVAAMFMAIMDTTIVNVALPTLSRDLHARAASVDLVSIAFLVSLGVFIPMSGWLGDRLGGRRALLAAVAIFTVASALCGLSTSLVELVVFRVVQGIGGGLMTPIGLSMLFRAFPPEERVRASSILTVPTALAPASGPVLGGWFTADLSWRWVFFVNVPIGLAALGFGALFLAADRRPDPGRLDRWGFALSGLGLGTAMYAVSRGPVSGWSSPEVLATGVVGVSLLVAMVLVERRRPDPLIDVRLFADRLFRSGTLVLVAGSVAYLGALYLATLFFQDGLGMSALAAGLMVLPSAVGVMVGGQVVTRALYPRVGPRRIMVGGLALVAISLSLMALTGEGTDRWSVRLIMLGLGLGVSATFVPSQAASMATITPARTARAAAIYNAGKQLGGAIGIAVLTTVLAGVGPTRRVAGHVVVHLAAYHAAFLVAATAAVLGIGAALTVRDGDAAATVTRRRATRPGRPVLAARS